MNLFRAYHHIKLLIIDLTVTINIYLVNQALNLILLHLFSQIIHDIAKLLSVDKTITILKYDV